jgi:hypothetical protein
MRQCRPNAGGGTVAGPNERGSRRHESRFGLGNRVRVGYQRANNL